MKKTIGFFIILFCFPLISFSQKGEKSVAFNGGWCAKVTSWNNNSYAGTGFALRFLYHTSDHFRIAPGVNYYFIPNHDNREEINLDFHYLFNISHNIKIYPVLGAKYIFSMSVPGINYGIGIQSKLTTKVNLNLEARNDFQIYDEGYQQFYISAGVTYSF